MKRWIISGSISLFIVVIIDVLFSLNYLSHSTSAENFISSQSTVSVVTIAKPKPVKKTVPQETVKEKKVIDDNSIKKVIDQPVEVEETEEVEVEQEEVNEEVVEQVEQEEVDEETSQELSDTESVAAAAEKREASPAELSYKQKALLKISKKKSYPLQARMNGYEGKIKLKLFLNKNGELISCEILESSSYDILDEAAISSIKKSAPFGKLPDGQETLSLTFTMDFSLN